jgi:6,7-dimethyl-8-ribityllumazine synthase
MLGANKGQPDERSRLPDGKKFSIAIVQARFNEPITKALVAACQAELLTLGVVQKNITVVQVPGALEIPVTLLMLAEQMKYDALVAVGCVIRGETYHFELVANESSAGLSRISLDYQVPVVNAILTTESVGQAQRRQTEKGRDAARVAVEMAHLMQSL